MGSGGVTYKRLVSYCQVIQLLCEDTNLLNHAKIPFFSFHSCYNLIGTVFNIVHCRSCFNEICSTIFKNCVYFYSLITKYCTLWAVVLSAHMLKPMHMLCPEYIDMPIAAL